MERVRLSDSIDRLRHALTLVSGGGLIMGPQSARDFLAELDVAAAEARRQETIIDTLESDGASQIADRIARLKAREAQIDERATPALQRVAAQIKAARPSVVIQISPYARVTRTLSEGDVAAAVNAIADAIGVARPIDMLEGDAPPPRDPLARDLAEDGA